MANPKYFHKIAINTKAVEEFAAHGSALDKLLAETKTAITGIYESAKKEGIEESNKIIGTLKNHPVFNKEVSQKEIKQGIDYLKNTETQNKLMANEATRIQNQKGYNSAVDDILGDIKSPKETVNKLPGSENLSNIIKQKPSEKAETVYKNIENNPLILHPSASSSSVKRELNLDKADELYNTKLKDSTSKLVEPMSPEEQLSTYKNLVKEKDAVNKKIVDQYNYENNPETGFTHNLPPREINTNTNTSVVPYQVVTTDTSVVPYQTDKLKNLETSNPHIISPNSERENILNNIGKGPNDTAKNFNTQEEKSDKIWPWLALGTGTVGLGGGTYALTRNNKKKGKK